MGSLVNPNSLDNLAVAARQNAGIARVRLIYDPHTEIGMDGSTINLAQRLQVSAYDFEGSDLRIETERKRKRKSGKRGHQWVRSSHSPAGGNPFDGGCFRGGQHFDDNGNLIERETIWPVTDKFQWTNVPVAQWFKLGQVETNNGTFTSPVVSGEYTSNRYDFPVKPVRWKSIGGPVTLALRFVPTLPNLRCDNQFPQDRLTGVPSEIVSITHTRDGIYPKGKPVWPDGSGEADGENSSSLIMTISGDVF